MPPTPLQSQWSIHEKGEIRNTAWVTPCVLRHLFLKKNLEGRKPLEKRSLFDMYESVWGILDGICTYVIRCGVCIAPQILFNTANTPSPACRSCNHITINVKPILPAPQGTFSDCDCVSLGCNRSFPAFAVLAQISRSKMPNCCGTKYRANRWLVRCISWMIHRSYR